MYLKYVHCRHFNQNSTGPHWSLAFTAWRTSLGGGCGGGGNFGGVGRLRRRIILGPADSSGAGPPPSQYVSPLEAENPGATNHLRDNRFQVHNSTSADCLRVALNASHRGCEFASPQAGYNALCGAHAGSNQFTGHAEFICQCGVNVAGYPVTALHSHFPRLAFQRPEAGSQLLVKENRFEHVSAMLDRCHHMGDGLSHFSFTPDHHLSGQYQPLNSGTRVCDLAYPGKIKQPLPG